MKKTMATLLCALLIFTLAACGKEAAPAKEVDVPQLADDMLAALDCQGEMMELTGSAAESYYEMGDLVKEYKIYVSNMYIAEEVAVFRLSDAGKTKEGKAMVEARIQYLLDKLDGYRPEEFEVMKENALVLSGGDIVCFLVGVDPGREAAKKLFDAAVE